MRRHLTVKLVVNTHQGEHLFSIDCSHALGSEAAALTFYFRGVTSQSLDSFNYDSKTVVKGENLSLTRDTTLQFN